jgi:hypothetical protein
VEFDDARAKKNLLVSRAFQQSWLRDFIDCKLSSWKRVFGAIGYFFATICTFCILSYPRNMFLLYLRRREELYAMETFARGLDDGIRWQSPLPA